MPRVMVLGRGLRLHFKVQMWGYSASNSLPLIPSAGEAASAAAARRRETDSCPFPSMSPCFPLAEAAVAVAEEGEGCSRGPRSL